MCDILLEWQKICCRYIDTLMERQHCIITLYAIARLSITRVDHTKKIEVTIMKFSPYGSPITLAFAG